MEEILASIRRIIAEDDPEPVIQPPRPAAAPAPAPIAAPPPAAAVSTEAIDALFAVKPPAPAPAPAAARPAVVPPPAPSLPPTPAAGPSVPPPSRPAFAAAPPPKTELPFRRESRASAAAPDPARKEEIQAGRPLLSPGTDAIVNAAFGSLTGSATAGSLPTGSSRTIEDLVKEMLRPMLKTWLDTNLPPLVERLVRDEIERVSRGR